MICSFGDKDTERVFRQVQIKGLPIELQRISLRKLVMLHNSHELKDLRIPPANRLEKLKGDREGQYSIRINDQWRICFEWRDGNAFGVEIVDYH